MENLVAIRRLQESDPERAQLAHALAILQDRISRMPVKDRDDLFELQKCLACVQDAQERDEVFKTMMEILDQRPIKPEAMTGSPAGEQSLRSNWIAFVSPKIKHQREAAGLTQDQLSAKSGIPQPHISRLEKGQHSPTRLTLEKLAAALDIDIKVFDPSE